MVSGHDDLGKRDWGDGSVGRTFVHKTCKSRHGHPCLKSQCSYCETGVETVESLETHRSASLVNAMNSRNPVSNKMEDKDQHLRFLSDLCMYTMKCVHACPWACMCMHTHTPQIYTCTYIIHIHSHTHAHTHSYTHMHMLTTDIHMHAHHTYKNLLTRKHRYTNMQNGTIGILRKADHT